MKFIELFAGIGGFRYGLEKSGDFQCLWSNEWDKYACQIYRKHYGELYEGDITGIDTKDIPDHDLLVGGFPCQAFSIAGNRRGFADIRGTLFFEIVRILRDKKPKCVLLENVKGLLSHDSGQTFQTILKTLSDIGYRAEWQVLNSKHYGVPQNRERVFIIGHLRGSGRQQVFPIRESNRAGFSEQGKGSFREHKDRQNSTAVTSRQFKGGGQLLELTEKQSQGYRVYDPEGVSSTLAGQAGGVGAKTGLYEVGTRIRRLTPTECERLQGFPDGWTEGISDTQRYKCLGNAVTTNVITAIGEALWKSVS